MLAIFDIAAHAGIGKLELESHLEESRSWSIYLSSVSVPCPSLLRRFQNSFGRIVQQPRSSLCWTTRENKQPLAWVFVWCRLRATSSSFRLFFAAFLWCMQSRYSRTTCPRFVFADSFTIAKPLMKAQSWRHVNAASLTGTPHPD
jgi:hypothetical protein